jgi:hypothetical protein
MGSAFYMAILANYYQKGFMTPQNTQLATETMRKARSIDVADEVTYYEYRILLELQGKDDELLELSLRDLHNGDKRAAYPIMKVYKRMGDHMNTKKYYDIMTNHSLKFGYTIKDIKAFLLEHKLLSRFQRGSKQADKVYGLLTDFVESMNSEADLYRRVDAKGTDYILIFDTYKPNDGMICIDIKLHIIRDDGTTETVTLPVDYENWTWTVDDNVLIELDTTAFDLYDELKYNRYTKNILERVGLGWYKKVHPEE